MRSKISKHITGKLIAALLIIFSIAVTDVAYCNAAGFETTAKVGAIDQNKLIVNVGSNEFTVSLKNNESANALKNMLLGGPVTISCKNYGGFEKVCSLGRRLPQNDVQTVTAPGDVMLYNGDQIVFFYAPNSWAYTRLGKVDDAYISSLNAILGGPETELTLRLGSATVDDDPDPVDPVDVDDGVGRVAMKRLFNPNSGEHFYTASDAEKNNLVLGGWKYEGIGWYAPKTSGKPVYRLFNPINGDHHYTLSESERKACVAAGWKYEGVGWFSDEAETVPIYREFNPNANMGSHNYTSDKSEHDHLVSSGWIDENIGWYGI